MLLLHGSEALPKFFHKIWYAWLTLTKTVRPDLGHSDTCTECGLDVFLALTKAIKTVMTREHDPNSAHERVKSFYSWDDVAQRTEKVYQSVLNAPEIDLRTRLQRYSFLVTVLITAALTVGIAGLCGLDLLLVQYTVL